jgi:RNA 3'-terminal phosphate cyclase-like protein
LEPLVILLPFAKFQTTLTLDGITNDNIDLSVDLIRTVILPQLSKFGISDLLDLKILKRGAPPLGGGQIQLVIPIVKVLKPIQHVQPGLVKKIRGISYCTRMSPMMATRVVNSARGLLTRYIPDVYLFADVYKGFNRV